MDSYSFEDEVFVLSEWEVDLKFLVGDVLDVVGSDYLLHFVGWVELDQFADMAEFGRFLLLQA